MGDLKELYPVGSTRSQKTRNQDVEALINSILPSYHMFESTISKKLTPNEESFKEDPPTYELSPFNSGGVTPVCSTVHHSTENLEFPFDAANRPQDPQAPETFNQSSADYWESTVLANVHKLDNLAEKNNHMAKHLSVQLYFTDEICQKGLRPNLIDPSTTEYQQGDYIHGFITIKNDYHEAIPFDMVYVALEGILCIVNSAGGVKDESNPPTVVKFLNMLDLFASWSYANIDRLTTDSGDPHDWCEGERDPWDNTVLSIDVKRLFRPGVTYKRFFSFRIPDRLLDDTCEMHSLDSHCSLLPSLGCFRNLNSSQKQSSSNDGSRDLSFMDSFIGYSVSARVIGRASQYNFKSNREKYVLAQEASMALRLLPQSLSSEYSEFNSQNTTAYYKAFMSSVEKKIEQGKLAVEQMRARGKSASPLALTPFNSCSSRPSISSFQDRIKHSFTSTTGRSTKKNQEKRTEDESFRHVSSFRKKTLTGYSKILGTLYLSSPKVTVKLQYIPPLKYRNPFQGYQTTMQIPLELSYLCEDDKQKAPNPIDLSCELIVLTIRSKKHFIPIEFNHEMCHRDEYIDDMAHQKVENMDLFQSMVVKPSLDHYHTLISLMKEIGFDNDAFRVETSLFKDIKSMASLQTKRINLAVQDVKIRHTSEKGIGNHESISSVPWSRKSLANSSGQIVWKKEVMLDIDFSSCHLKGTADVESGKSAFDRICLVPDFQSCLMSRLYFLGIKVRYKNGGFQMIHIPLSIVS